MPLANAANRILGSERSRFLIYATIAALSCLLAVLFVMMKHNFNFVVSDGRGYYVYLPSLVVDGDLDFSNQIQEHWDTDYSPDLLKDRTEVGYVRDKYPIGFSLTLLPSFLLAHALSHLVHGMVGASAFTPDGYSVLYQLFALISVLGLGLATMCAIDRMLQQRYQLPGVSIGLAVVIYWLGSHYSYYYFREPLMVHVTSAFWVTACIYFGSKILTKAELTHGRNLAICSFAFGMALVARPTNAFLLFFVAYVFWQQLRQHHLANLIKSALVAVVPIILQMTVWKIMNGHWISYSYGDEGFKYKASPFLVSTLFSSLHGLFFWSPMIALALVGIFLRYRAVGIKHDPVLMTLGLGALALWYFNSSWHQWWFGDAFGGRAFLELTALFVFGLAFLIERLRASGRSIQLAGSGVIVIAALVNYGLMVLYIGHKIPRADYLC